MSLYVAGLDLGQAQDFSALIISEVIATPIRLEYEGEIMGLPSTEWLHMQVLPIMRLNLRHIERFPLGTKYQQIAHLVAQRMRPVPRPWYLAVDQTGVGAGVMEMLMPLNPIGISITGGREVIYAGGQNFHVPKRDLVGILQVITQQRVLKFAKGLDHAELLAREMQNFRAKITASGADTYEAWRESDHDDLVLAAAINAWTATEVLRLREGQVHEAIRLAAMKDYQISPV
jgi:hypothetical protein